MNQLKSLKIMALLLLSGWIAAHSFPKCVEASSPAELDAERVTWRRLSFHAKNFWVEVSTDIQLASMPATETEGLLISAGKRTPVRSLAAEAYQMQINTTIDPRFRSAVSIYNRIWFDPTQAAALGRVRLRRGGDQFKKIYRFTTQGVFRHRLEPQNKKEASLAPEKWTDRNNSFYAYDRTRLECSGVSERTLLIYIISAAIESLEKDALSVCVFGKRQLHRVTLRKSGEYPIRISYIENHPQKATRKEKTLKAVKIAVKAEPLESDLKEDENFSFLGLHQDIAIYIDRTTGLPLQVNGIIPTVGNVSLQLRKADLKR